MVFVDTLFILLQDETAGSLLTVEIRSQRQNTCTCYLTIAQSLYLIIADIDRLT